jgi:serine/threonine protein kinase
MLFSLMEPNLSIPGSVHDLPFLSMGVSSMVYEVSEIAIIKAPCGTDESLHQLAVERAIYKRLGSHPYITKVLSTHRNMLVLERLQYPLRKRLWDLRDAGQLPPPLDVLRWAAQIAQALQHAHSRGVLQVDIGPHNVLLDWNENVKLSHRSKSAILLAMLAPFVGPSLHPVDGKAGSLSSLSVPYPIEVELARTIHPVSLDFRKCLVQTTVRDY